MRRQVQLTLLLLRAIPIFPIALHAQFLEPIKEELQMAEDPKALGSDAVYLDRVIIADDSDHVVMVYERIKVLREKGKELATVRIPYLHGTNKVTNVEGRTIHADGTIVALTVKPSDLTEFKSKDLQLSSIVFTLPSVEVGSILEYQYKIHSPTTRVLEPVWYLQQSYFVHKEFYGFRPSTDGYVIDSEGRKLEFLMFTQRLRKGDSVHFYRSKNLYSINLADVPSIPKDDWMPPLNTWQWRVQFYHTNNLLGSQFWLDASKRWAKKSNEFAYPSSTLKAAVTSIVSPSDPDEQKARKIYAAVQKLDNTSFSRAKSEAERKNEKLKDIRKAEDVWNQQSGSDDEIALLFVALCRAAGLKVYPMQVVDRDRAIFDEQYLSLSQLDDYIAAIVLDGKELYVDPGQKMAPFGTLHWKHTLATGYRLYDFGPAPAMTPAGSYDTAVTHRVASLNLDQDGSLNGTVRIAMSGPEALHWRQLALEIDPDELKKRFNKSITNDLPGGVTADFDRFVGIEDYSSDLRAILTVTGHLGSTTGRRFILPGLFFEASAKLPFVTQANRESPIDVLYARTDKDDVTYHLPPSFSIESLPNGTNEAWPDHALLKTDFSSSAPNSAYIQRTLAYNYVLLSAADYPNLHNFYLKVAAADQQQLVFNRTPAVGKAD